MIRFGAVLFCCFMSCTSVGETSSSEKPTASSNQEAAQPKGVKVKPVTIEPANKAPTQTVKALPKKPEPPAAAKAAPAPALNATVNTLVDAIQRQYNSLRSSTFDFEQSYKHPFLNVTETSKGNVSYQKLGGKIVWSYLEPKERQKKFYVSGNKLTYYSATDKIAYTHDCYDRDTLSASVAFLLGSGNLKSSFVISANDGEGLSKELTWLTLVPNEKDAPVKKILLGVNKEAKVMESVVEDPTGGKNHFKFINFKTNPKIAASVFVFVAPAGVTVQPMPNVTCPTKAEPIKAEPSKTKPTPTPPSKPSAPPAKPKISG